MMLGDFEKPKYKQNFSNFKTGRFLDV